MQKIFIEVDSQESEHLEKMLKVNRYCFYKYHHEDRNILLVIDVEGYQINLLNSLIHKYIRENKDKRQSIHVFLAMDVGFLNE